MLNFFLGILVTILILWLYEKTRESRPGLQGNSTEDRIRRLERQYDVLSPAILPISTAFQMVLRKELTHFHTQEMDELLERLGPPYSLTEEEAERLGVMLGERALDMGDTISPKERDSALMLPMVIKRVKAEVDSAGSEPLVRIIMVAQEDYVESLL